MSELSEPERGTLDALSAQFADLIGRLERGGGEGRSVARELERELAVLVEEVMRMPDAEPRRVLVAVARDLTANLWALRDGLPPIVEPAEMRRRLQALPQGGD